MPPKNAPLGYVELDNGSKAIYPMNDIFLNYTFESTAHWEALRLTINLLIDGYKQQHPSTDVMPIEGKIVVRTQFRHLLGIDGKTTRDQDIKITEDDGESTYIEFQNKANTQPPIEVRSVEYFGLGIGHSKGKRSNQMWLMAEDVDAVLHGKAFARYILKDEATGKTHPATSGIMYVSLSRLSKESGPVSELAAFLLGSTECPQYDIVRKITMSFNSSFDAFKADKEVTTMLSLRERGWYEGLAEGEARGEAKGRAEGILEAAAKLLSKGVDFNFVAEALKLSESEISQLKSPSA